MINSRETNPESYMMSLGYNPFWSQGAEKTPIFLSSTYRFKTAEELERAFSIAYGLCKAEINECPNLIYARINHPNLQIAEERLARWEKGAESCAIFSSGMAAITTLFSEFLKPGDILLRGGPLYGGTDHYITKVLPSKGVQVISFNSQNTKEEIIKMVKAKNPENLALIYVETPTNPTNDLFDISELRFIADHFSTADKKVFLAVDNTYLGPIFQYPLPHGADMVIYSATKYIGGHSDLIAGACVGLEELINRMKVCRTFLGNAADPFTCWLIQRSLETLKVRMSQQVSSADIIAQYLNHHSLIERVYFLGNIGPEDGKLYKIKNRQCKSNGAMIAFDVSGGKAATYKFLNSLEIISLAVSLGGNESLVEVPFFMTHADVSDESKKALGINENMIRLSVGIEDVSDLIKDIEQALKKAAA